MKTWPMVCAIGATLSLAAVSAQADPVNFDRAPLLIPFNVGTGNSNTNFAITRNADQSEYIELGIKAKQRFIGDADVGGSGTTYIVPRGFSQNDPLGQPAGAWWNFDYSVDLGGRSLANTIVFLRIFFNGLLVQDLNSDQFIALGQASSTDQVLQGSENINWLGLDPNALGTYTFELEAREKTGGPIQPFIAGVTMQTIVVPLPTTAGMAFAGLGLMAARRRR
ncbi:MAG: PEP-CTERM sorting domain-containing protein [Halieaceae bacterium]|jgi:hypothetical protein|nr:PEP-CTERM sorting domain-containing protein [Halieaceae bacterium]